MIQLINILQLLNVLFEIEFKSSKDLIIKINEKEFILLENNGTKDRKKITLINFNISSITVNQKVINVTRKKKQ